MRGGSPAAVEAGETVAEQSPAAGEPRWAVEVAGTSVPDRLASVAEDGGRCRRSRAGGGGSGGVSHSVSARCSSGARKTETTVACVRFGKSGGAEDKVESREDLDRWLIN